ncbi:hypothetical protein F3Y22_tig00110356pilonHSYRG00094 [Hibiscus syriacus]|uniref:PHD-type domain-containing protein n=1 Tax=Hibiscus syriacus TaxID=106335 RepID=A0A6A3AYQ7_HIBSY|nr:hypothetical protein F3Y22_tig00110356pilonHSYRG00094 [Hibiscus syriacus]
MPDPSPLLHPCSRFTMKSNKDEANGEHNVDGKNHGASGDAGSIQIKDNHNNSNAAADVDGKGNGNVNDDVHADLDDMVDGDEEEMVDGCTRSYHARDCIAVDCLKGEYCFECNSRSGQVFICNENGCPVAFHEECMTWKPKFDEMGKFYCPYCLYRQEGARLKEFRLKAMLAEKELSNFICLKRGGGSREKKEGGMVSMKGASVSTMARDVSYADCGNGLNYDDEETIHHNQDGTLGVESRNKEKSLERNISRAHGFDKVGNEERMQEDIEIPNVEYNEADKGELVLLNAVGTTLHSLIPILGTEKRRKLNWTAEEEDMLKERCVDSWSGPTLGAFARLQIMFLDYSDRTD